MIDNLHIIADFVDNPQSRMIHIDTDNRKEQYLIFHKKLSGVKINT